MSFIARLRPLILSLFPVFLVVPANAADGQVNVYSARKESLILPLLERFREDTGIDFKLVTGKADALLSRLEIEGEATPADVFITTDAGRLQRAKEAGVLQPVNSDALESALPAHLKDRENYWFGLSQRARVIFYARDRVDPANLSTYEALANDNWRGRFCVRSSSNIYNQSLVASMIEHDGGDQTEAWARSLVSNFARQPAGGDTDQLRAVAAGQCDLALANTYYYGRLVNSDKEADQAVADTVGLFWPNQQGRGAHVNVSGAGVTRHASHADAAVKLIEYLLKPESQQWYAEVNNEYPVIDDVPVSATLESFGSFKADTLDLTVLGENNGAALQLMDRAGWK